jgi:hypothetical protein
LVLLGGLIVVLGGFIVVRALSSLSSSSGTPAAPTAQTVEKPDTAPTSTQATTPQAVAKSPAQPTATPAPPTATAAPPTATAVPPTSTPAVAQFTNENWQLALGDANRYKNTPVLLTGRVFLDPQVTNEAVAFQMNAFPTQNSGNTIVVTAPSLKVKRGDYVRVEGQLIDMFTGTNAFGGQVSAPRVRGSKVDIVSREEVVAPAIKTYELNRPLDQNGLVITLIRLELAANETRAYVKISNRSPDKASVYVYQAKLLQGQRQFDRKSVFDAGYPDIPSSLLPGVEAETVLLFDQVNPSETVRLVWDGPRTDNYKLSFKPFEWSAGP